MGLHFYDSANPKSIPSGVHAAVCVDGHYTWAEEDIKRMAKVFRYTCEGGAEKAKVARGIDIEEGCVWPPENAMSFLIARHRSNGDATAYCDRSTLPTVQALVKKARIEVLYWVATLDGTQTVEGSWAVQYQGGIHSAYDVSVLHGTDNFVKP